MATTFDPTIPVDQRDKPLAGLDTNQYKYASFIYPLDLGAPGAGLDHYMVFHINETSLTQFHTRTGTGTFSGTTNPDGTLAGPTDIPTVNANGASQPIRRVATTIVLYMPGSIVTNYSAEWQVAELGAARELIDASVGHTSLTEFFKSAGISGGANGLTALNEFTGLSLKEAIGSKARLAINNHAEVIFNGIGFRSFQFNFRFTPQSEEEAVNVDNIIRAFKFYAAPEIIQGAAGRFWIYPAEFDLQYYSNGKENLFLNKISTCALTDISVNYTPQSHFAAHRAHNQIQGAPSVCVDLSMTYKELEIMTKNRILNSY
jgi:hypothetical protein